MSDSYKAPRHRFHFRFPMQVRFRDVDSMGHVNHAVYFSYFEMARCEYWMKLLRLKKLSDLGIIVVRAECNYRSAAEYAEWLEVFTGITEIRNSSFVMEYEIWARRPRRLVADGSSIQALFNYSENRTIRIPPGLRKKIVRHEKRQFTRGSLSKQEES